MISQSPFVLFFVFWRKTYCQWGRWSPQAKTQSRSPPPPPTLRWSTSLSQTGALFASTRRAWLILNQKICTEIIIDYYCIAPTPCPDHWSNLNKYQRTESVNAQPLRGSAPQLGPHESPDQWRCPFLSAPNTRGGQRPICQSCLSRETRHDGVNIGLKL